MISNNAAGAADLHPAKWVMFQYEKGSTFK